MSALFFDGVRYATELSWGNAGDATNFCVEIRKCLWTLLLELVNTTDSISLNTIVQPGNRDILYDMVMCEHMIFLKKNPKMLMNTAQILNIEESLEAICKSQGGKELSIGVTGQVVQNTK